METYVNFKYRDPSGEELDGFRIEPGTQIPARGEIVTLQDKVYEVIQHWHVYTGFRGNYRNHYITIIVTDVAEQSPLLP